MPLLLLGTPQRATLHELRHHAGAGAERVHADATVARLSTSWRTPVVFADLMASASTPSSTSTVATPATGALDTGSLTRLESVSFRQPLSTPTTTITAIPSAASTTASAAPAPKPAASVPSAPPSITAGIASWYGAPAGTCASPTLVFGTVVTVTDLATGVSLRCTVDDREAHNPGRVIDLAPATFSQLASPSVGLIEVRLSW